MSASLPAAWASSATATATMKLVFWLFLHTPAESLLSSYLSPKENIASLHHFLPLVWRLAALVEFLILYEPHPLILTTTTNVIGAQGLLLALCLGFIRGIA